MDAFCIGAKNESNSIRIFVKFEFFEWKSNRVRFEFASSSIKIFKLYRCENLLDFFPKCFYGDEDMVVLENLVLDDTFIMLDKEIRHDLFTAK